MFEALMKMGGYRVDYLNKNAAGKPDALGFYVCGQRHNRQAYSRIAKHHLFAGMLFVQKELGVQNLVGVYLDVNCPENLGRVAYQQLKSDLRAGMFRRVFVYDIKDLIGAPEIEADLYALHQELGGFEVLYATDNSSQPSSLLKIYQPARYYCLAD